MQDNAPALPWAAPAQTPAAAKPSDGEQDKQTNAQQDAPARRLAAGDRIEVKWQLQTEDGNDSCRWWGARVEGVTGAVGGFEVWTLRYDAYQEFEEESANVVVFPGQWLHDVGQGDDGFLRWKFEGDAEPDEEDEEEMDELEEEEEMDYVLDGQQVLDLVNQHEQDTGQSSEQEALEALAASCSNPAQQLHVAAGFRDMVDHIKEQVRQRIEASGSGSYTVTADDVQQIFSKLKDK